MNYNFTDRVRKVLAMAREEAVRLQHDYVGTEHILLGLIREGEGVAAAALTNLNIELERIHERIEELLRKGKATIALGELPYTSRAKKVLEYAMAEARELKHAYVGTEHLLLGLLREEKGIAAQVLMSFGLTLEDARAEVLRLLTGGPPRAVSAEKPPPAKPVWFLEVDPALELPIYGQIISRIEEAVATGRLEPGERLPTVRQLAEELGIAPGTVARAYSELEQRGILETEGARGTRVSMRTATPKRAETDANGSTLEGLLRPVAVAAFHLGATAEQLRKALERAMKDILRVFTL
jgi:DNA-binding transcriptional regulator YhcF (GntR family)